MILSELRSYLQEKHRATLGDMALHFKIDADALRGMLDKWISKGKVIRSSANAACGSSCCKCDPLLTEIYEWVD